jgi:uncharacterized membrane protein required for colicin V production
VSAGQAADLVIGGALLAFLVWGAFHGALRQLLGLVVLAVAFALAPVLGPLLESVVRKLFDVPRDDLAVASWGLALVAVAVAGGVLLHALRGPLARARLGGGLDRWIGGIVGVAKGLVVLGVLVYAALAWWSGESAPAVVRWVEESRSARLFEAIERRLSPVLRLPAPVARRVEEVNRRIGVEGVS